MNGIGCSLRRFDFKLELVVSSHVIGSYRDVNFEFLKLVQDIISGSSVIPVSTVNPLSSVNSVGFVSGSE